MVPSPFLSIFVPLPKPKSSIKGGADSFDTKCGKADDAVNAGSPCKVAVAMSFAREEG